MEYHPALYVHQYCGGSGLGLQMGKFHRVLIGLTAHHTIIAGYCHFMFLFVSKRCNMQCSSSERKQKMFTLYYSLFLSIYSIHVA